MVLWQEDGILAEKEFEQAILQNWAKHFRCTVAEFGQSGTTLFPEWTLAAARGIHIWYIGAHAFVQMDPAYVGMVQQVLRILPEHEALSGEDLQTAWGIETIAAHELSLVYYISPPDLRPATINGSYTLRRLTETDSELLRALFAASPAEDIDEAYVSLEHKIAVGCFSADGRLVSAGSGYERSHFVDLGVLTHPEYRGQGLGRAVVVGMCRRLFAKHEIPQYRTNVDNIGSRHLAESVGFVPYFKQESIYIR
ncbi:MAG: GNAT family N-acetyltransferase [Chloroflexi bacterium]|nr:MAG: GNAT family N-acetyltransferase [Chloroflexota bacterium]